MNMQTCGFLRAGSLATWMKIRRCAGRPKDTPDNIDTPAARPASGQSAAPVDMPDFSDLKASKLGLEDRFPFNCMSKVRFVAEHSKLGQRHIFASAI